VGASEARVVIEIGRGNICLVGIDSVFRPIMMMMTILSQHSENGRIPTGLETSLIYLPPSLMLVIAQMPIMLRLLVAFCRFVTVRLLVTFYQLVISRLVITFTSSSYRGSSSLLPNI
jgi:hypothetical protein